MCAIERHPDSSTRDSLTHTLFNLIKRPDAEQRRIIMDVRLSKAFFIQEFIQKVEHSTKFCYHVQACVTLARNVGEMRTETELLPQCWEQVRLFCSAGSSHDLPYAASTLATSHCVIIVMCRSITCMRSAACQLLNLVENLLNSCALRFEILLSCLLCNSSSRILLQLFGRLLLIIWRCCCLSSQVWTNISRSASLHKLRGNHGEEL